MLKDLSPRDGELVLSMWTEKVKRELIRNEAVERLYQDIVTGIHGRTQHHSGDQKFSHQTGAKLHNQLGRLFRTHPPPFPLGTLKIRRMVFALTPKKTGGSFSLSVLHSIDWAIGGRCLTLSSHPESCEYSIHGVFFSLNFLSEVHIPLV